jgi:hypothetical protein
MTHNAMPNSHSLPTTVTMPRLDDDAVIQIHDFIHQILDLFEARYGDQIRRFYEDLGGQDMLPGIDNVDDPPF